MLLALIANQFLCSVYKHIFRSSGALAERGLRAILPAESEFTTRLTSEVLESNGENADIHYIESQNSIPDKLRKNIKSISCYNAKWHWRFIVVLLCAVVKITAFHLSSLSPCLSVSVIFLPLSIALPPCLSFPPFLSPYIYTSFSSLPCRLPKVSRWAHLIGILIFLIQ